MAGSNIGDKIYFSAALPATEDVIGYAALTWTEAAEVLTIGEFGDTPGESTVAPLSGRIKRYIGSIDGGKLAIKIENVPADAGQVIIDNGIDNGVNHSVKIVAGATGEAFHLYGLFANKKYTERADGGTDDITFEVWVNSKVV